MKHPHNGDAFVITENGGGGADGVGSLPNDHLAAQAIVTEQEKILTSSDPMRLEKAHADAQAIFQKTPELKRSAVAHTSFAFEERGAELWIKVVHSGDVPLLVISSQAQIRERTKDHISMYEDKDGVFRPVLNNALNADPDAWVETTWYQLYDGDTILLTSDGLPKILQEEGLAAITARYSPLEAARLFLEEVDKRKSHDDVTFIIVKIALA